MTRYYGWGAEKFGYVGGDSPMANIISKNPEGIKTSILYSEPI